MFEFEPSAMAELAQWMQQHAIAFGLGLVLGVMGSAVTFARKMLRLRRDGVL